MGPWSLWLPLLLLSLYAPSCLSRTTPPSNPFPAGQLPDPTNALEVDLGYAGYTGVNNGSLNYWYGIPYAQPPLGNLRWQASIPPQTTFNGTFVNASTMGAECPQVIAHTNIPMPAWTASSSQSEDCLVLNVWSPADAVNLPVFVWIHGGGYGSGSGNYNMPFLINASESKFVGVTIQYRLGAFGFLAGNEVQHYGTANAGLHDQYLALQWVQNYISLFGGDPNRVTLGGESAGGGSVMLQSMAYGGAVGDELFNGVFASSPYLPQQWNYNDPATVAAYEKFANLAGCSKHTAKNVFECLVAQDTAILQNASYTTTINGKFGQWAFLPVTDGNFLQVRPSVQLTHGRVNGNWGLIGNNANEGFDFVPQNISTECDFREYIHYLMPNLKVKEVQAILAQYPMPPEPPTVRFATDGVDENATAVFVSPFAVGQQQRANNLYAEMTFVCPSYWLAEAFGRNSGQSFKYQYSLVNSLHGEDLAAYFQFFGYLLDTMSQAFQDSFISFLNSFIVNGVPSDANTYMSDVPADITEVLASWPPYTWQNPLQMSLNQTGGYLTADTDLENYYYFETETYTEPGLVPKFTVVNAYDWEGGRGARCDFWKSIGGLVPEKK